MGYSYKLTVIPVNIRLLDIHWDQSPPLNLAWTLQKTFIEMAKQFDYMGSKFVWGDS